MECTVEGNHAFSDCPVGPSVPVRIVMFSLHAIIKYTNEAA